MLGPSWPGLAWAACRCSGAMASWPGEARARSARSPSGSVRLSSRSSLLGLVLGWVFAADNPWPRAPGRRDRCWRRRPPRVGSRHRRTRWTLRMEGLGAMILGAAVVMAVATRLAMAMTPWYDPRTVIPMLGMILGNSVNGVALAAKRLASELRGERDRVELAARPRHDLPTGGRPRPPSRGPGGPDADDQRHDDRRDRRHPRDDDRPDPRPAQPSIRHSATRCSSTS